ncbi:MAG: aggregation factor core [Pseudomonadota bacterium]
MKITLPLAALVLSAPIAHADITARFIEGAPKDRFELVNDSACALPPGVLTIDIGTAPAGLIFDVTASGAGVEVFQPFELVAGGDSLSALPRVADGDQAIALPIAGLAPGARIAFTIDVDDTGGGREITVSGSEMAGASVRATLDGATYSAAFNETARARLDLPACGS